jgi:hypothetical protein
MKNKIIENKYDFIGNFHNGFATVKIGEKWGVINEEFKKSKIIYDYVGDSHNRIITVRFGNKYGFINHKLEESKIIYDYAGNFHNGFARVKLNDKWGFINKQFKEIKIEYDEVDNFFNGFSKIKFDGKYGFIDKELRETEIIYDYAWFFKNNFARIKKGCEWGFLNNNFEEVSQEDVLSNLCYKEDKKFYWFKKILLKNLKSPTQFFQYKLRKEYKFNLDKYIEHDYAPGFNLATESWIKDNFNPHTEKIYLVKVPKKNNTIIIPFDMQKIRCERAILTNENL